MNGRDFIVRLWGVRGSYAVPGNSTLKYGGNTSCVEVRVKNHIIILDAGTGIINLGKRLLNEFRNNSIHISLLISHTHNDHLQGFPFFAPAYKPGCTLNIYGPKSFSQDLDQILTHTMEPQYSPIGLDELSSQINIHNLHENDILILNGSSQNPDIFTQDQVQQTTQNDVIIRVMRSYAHPKVGSYLFRVELNGKSMVYATDTEGYVGGDTRLIEFAKNTDLLIHDAQYEPEEYTDVRFPKQGFGHSTFAMAAQTAKSAHAKQLVLFHHDPLHDDAKIASMETEAKKLFHNSIAGAEGLEFSL